MPARRPANERVAVIDQKIAKKQAEIANLEAQKQRILHPVNMKTVLTMAKQAGLSPEEVAAKLGLKV